MNVFSHISSFSDVAWIKHVFDVKPVVIVRFLGI